jgi:hypothetical protein
MGGGAIGDRSSSKNGSTGNGGKGGTNRNTMGESKSSCVGGDRGSSGDGSGCYHQTHAEAMDDKRPTPQVLDPWSKTQTKEAPGEEDDAGRGAGTDEDSGEANGTTKSEKIDKGRGAGSAMSGGAAAAAAAMAAVDQKLAAVRSIVADIFLRHPRDSHQCRRIELQSRLSPQ